ncbi:MAG: hypothetical protein Q7T44_02190 [Parvibaculum sp.]|nr:hypothetical protein [Parvibaculum sp.]
MAIVLAVDHGFALSNPALASARSLEKSFSIRILNAGMCVRRVRYVDFLTFETLGLAQPFFCLALCQESPLIALFKFTKLLRRRGSKHKNIYRLKIENNHSFYSLPRPESTSSVRCKGNKST